MNASNLRQQAAELMAQQQYSEAATLYEQCIQVEPDERSHYWCLGLALLLGGDAEAAQMTWMAAMSHTEPDQADAVLHQLKDFLLAAAALPDPVAAEQICHQVLELDPTCEAAYDRLATVLFNQERLEEAIACLHELLAMNPNNINVYNNLGVLYDYQDQIDEAIACYHQATRLDPQNAPAFYNLGQLLERSNRFQEAIVCYRQVVELDPENASVLFKLAVLLEKYHEFAEAIACYRKVIALNPEEITAYSNLAVLLNRVGEFDEAIAIYQFLLTVQPNASHIYSAYGYALGQQGKFEQATAAVQQALALTPDEPETNNDLGIIYTQQGDVERAIRWYEQVLSRFPDNINTNWNYALALLQSGNYEQGFAAYEWRSKMPEIKPQTFPLPFWDGSDLQGKTILLHAEQGLGDTLQFVRYVPLVAQRGGNVTLLCQPPLVRLLRHSLEGVAQVLPLGVEPPPCELQSPLLSLPRLFNTTLETVSNQTPYLFPTDSTLQLDVPAGTRLKIGIVWSGGMAYKQNFHRSCPLKHFLPLLDLPGVAFYSLQKGPATADLKTVPGADRIHNLDAQIQDFTDTAAAIAQLDLVLTVDTSVPHLAGAMGCPTWLLLAFVPDWRWLLHRDDSPWYPQMRLFRQTQHADWEGVFQRVMDALKARLGI